MPLQPFSFPIPETRFIRAGGLVYKFRIRAGSSYRGDEAVEGNLSQELEDVIRTVLGNLDRLQPFSSPHFKVFPYETQWEGASEVMCNPGETRLRAYPFVLTLYVERNTQAGKQAQEKLSPRKDAREKFSVSELQPKCCAGASPLEGATLQGLSEHRAAVGRRLSMDSPRAEEEAYGDGGKESRGSAATGSAGPGEGPPEGTQEDDGEEPRGEAAAGNRQGPGIVTRLARQIFPFSWFFQRPLSAEATRATGGQNNGDLSSE